MDSIYTKNKINIASRECGCWKTYATCQHIKDNQNYCNHLYVAPTIILLEQTEKELTKIGVRYKVIHSENTIGKVASAIVKHLNDAYEMYDVLLITWEAYSAIPFFPKRNNWTVFIDEIPAIDKFYDLAVPYTYKYITDYLDIDEEIIINNSLAMVIPKDKDKGKLKRFIDEKGWRDIGYKPFYDLFRDVLNKNNDVFVDIASWNKICEDNDVSTHNEKNTVYFISLLNPEVFKNTTLLGANIEYSMFYDWMGRYHDVEFEENTEITKRLRKKINYNGRLRISYQFSGKANSKNLMKSKIPNSDETFQELIDENIAKQVGDDPFLLVVNKDYKGVLEELPKCKRIAVNSKGMNEYKDYTTIVHLAALNRKPKHFNMLNKLGFDNETIRTSTDYEVLYQNVMRTALREPKSTEIVDVIVVSEFEADFLIGMFGECEKKQIVAIEYKKYKPLTPIERNHVSKFNKVKYRLFSVVGDEIIETSHNNDTLSLLKENSNQNGKLLFPNEDNDMSNIPVKYTITPPSTINGRYLTLHGDIYGMEQEDFKVIEFSSHDLKLFLKDASNNPIKSKDKIFMINGSIFAPSDDPDGGYRRHVNFMESSMLILDFDDGDISISDFEDIFWNDAGRGLKNSFIICNSFSRSNDKPNKFRVFMPFRQPATSIDQYRAVFDSILKILEENGYTQDSMALDPQSRNPSQSFYVPCTNREFPDYQYFQSFGWKQADLNRCSIDPITIYKTTMQDVKKTNVVLLNPPKKDKPKKYDKESSIEWIKQEYLSIPIGQGKRNHGMYIAALKLSNYMEEYEIEQILYELACNDEDMIKRVPNKMVSLRKKKAA